MILPAHAAEPTDGDWLCRTGGIGPAQEFGAEIGTLTLTSASYRLNATNTPSGPGALGLGPVGFTVIDGPLVRDFAITRGNILPGMRETLQLFADAPLPVIGCTRVM